MARIIGHWTAGNHKQATPIGARITSSWRGTARRSAAFHRSTSTRDRPRAAARCGQDLRSALTDKNTEGIKHRLDDLLDRMKHAEQRGHTQKRARHFADRVSPGLARCLFGAAGLFLRSPSGSWSRARRQRVRQRHGRDLWRASALRKGFGERLTNGHSERAGESFQNGIRALDAKSAATY